MSTIASLSRSVSEMSDEELYARIRELRIARTAAPPASRPPKKDKSPPPIHQINPKSLTKEQALELLSLLEESMK